MDIKKLYGTNKEKEKDGVWLLFKGGIKFKIKRAGGDNKAFSVAYSKAIKPYQRQLMSGDMDKEVLHDINLKLYAIHIVTDWQGVEVDGEALEYTPSKFVELCKELPDLWNEVFEAANDMQRFQDAEDEELLGKLESSTDTD